MAKLTSKARKAMPASKFGEPGKRAYPMPNRSHAANAKARASEMEHKGKLSASARFRPNPSCSSLTTVNRSSR